MLFGGEMKYPKKMKKRTEKRSLPELISLVTDIPADLFSGGMTLEMRGRNELLLCGCREIIEYSKTVIRVLQSNCVVRICGRRLVMSSYSDGRVTVMGEIDSLDFCGGDVIGEKV
jgi:hypothetical protein